MCVFWPKGKRLCEAKRIWVAVCSVSQLISPFYQTKKFFLSLIQAMYSNLRHIKNVLFVQYDSKQFPVVQEIDRFGGDHRMQN